MKKAIILFAAALLVVGCDQQRQASNDTSTSTEKSQIKDSVKEAKDEVDRQAKAQKDMLNAEAKAAQAKLDAEKARAQAAGSDAQAKVDAASQSIRDAAGSAAARAQQEVGSASANARATLDSTTQPADQKLTEQVRAAITGGSGVEANAEATKNVQVSTSGGTVTLKGSVKTDAEKTQLETAAKAVPGVTKVDNQLQVKAE